MRALSLFFLPLVLLTACNAAGLRGNGVAATEKREVSDFTSFEANGALTIEWSSGATTVSIEGDENIVPHITTKVTDGVLKIEPDQPIITSHKLIVKLASAALKEVRLAGAVTADLHGVAGPSLKLHSDGAVTVKADGKVDNFNAAFAGASTLEAKGLQAKRTEISLLGASTAHVYASESLKADVEGASTIRYAGKPKSVEKKTLGASTISEE